MKVKDLIEQAYLAGWRGGLSAYAHWKNGEQLVGTCGKRLSEATREAPQDARPHFDNFMSQCEALWAPSNYAESLPAAVGGASDGSL